MKSLCVLFIFIILSTYQLDSEELHFVSIENLIKQEIAALVVKDIFKKIDIDDVTVTPFPGERAQQLANTGIKDGEILRIYGYGLDNPSLIRVPTPYYYVETMAFIKRDSNISITNRDDLSKYRLAKVLGVKHTNNITEGFDHVVNITKTDDMMKLLNADRFDIALTSTSGGLSSLKRLGLDDVITVTKPLATEALYIYLHEKHTELIPIIDSIIKEMKESGELEERIKKAEYIMYSAQTSTYSQ